MKRFILFSKSRWNETPRLRHQLANLLLSHGDEVLFFEKPARFVGFPSASSGADAPLLELFRTSELIHHQLRLNTCLRGLNAWYEKKQIKGKLRGKVSASDIVINFNYDYYFLRDVFPDNKIITIINDDFVAQSRFRNGRHASDVLKDTCRMSDRVLVVSYPLFDQVNAWCEPELFFPWADKKFVSNSSRERKVQDSVLLWAHVDTRIDFGLLHDVFSERRSFKLHVVGPIAPAVKQDAEKLSRLSNVSFLKPTKLDDMDLSRFFAAIIPYRFGQGDIEAVTLSNKSFQLMARGLPLVTHGMPAFYEHDAIFKCQAAEDFGAALDALNIKCDAMQNALEKLIAVHQPLTRYQQLIGER